MRHWLRNRATAVAPTIASASRSHVGHVRQINEDRLLDAPDRQFWAVADGMGGHAGGDRAATLVIEALAPLDRPDATAIVAALRAADALVRDSLPGSGSTVAALSIVDDTAHVVWAGDSRIYRRRDGAIERLTTDHSLVQELVDAGLIDTAQAADHPQGHVVTQAIGVAEDLTFGTTSTDAQRGDVFLLCTDGLTRRIGDADIMTLLEGEPAAITARAVELALRRDGSDNVSVVVVTLI